MRPMPHAEAYASPYKGSNGLPTVFAFSNTDLAKKLVMLGVK